MTTRPYYPRIRHEGREVYKHRLRMEQHVGRKLESWEHVHHRGAKTDDDPTHNELLTASEHGRIHAEYSRFWQHSRNYLLRAERQRLQLPLFVEQLSLELRPAIYLARRRDNYDLTHIGTAVQVAERLRRMAARHAP